MKNKKSYIQASSIIETVIAITVISICSLIATLIFTAVINTTPPVKIFQYKKELTVLVEDTFKNKTIAPFKNKYEGFSIEKKIFPDLMGNKNIKNVTFIVVAGKDTIQQSIKLFVNEN